ncbi:MAG: dUTPase [Christensenellaceae bacterium]|jgi:dimeric dUTPase (all-alpha-NTP-PPase superfamily)|nr:dUTPase [Christensenellaceae bacterium]
MEGDRLTKIFELQKMLDGDICGKRNVEKTREEWVKAELLALFSELNEVLSEVNFKWWKNPKEVNWDNVKDEIIDVLHFLVSLSLKTGMDESEFFARYEKKNEVNFARQRDIEGYKPEKL